MEQTVVQDLIDGRAEPGRVRAISLPHKQPRILIGVHPIGTFWTTVIGKKMVMAATGTVLVSFVIGHMLGNLGSSEIARRFLLSIWRTRPRSCPLSHSQRRRFELGVAEGAQSIEPD
jgi:hypothetical protein